MDGNKSGYKAGSVPPNVTTRVRREGSSFLEFEGPLCREVAALLEGRLCVRIRDTEGGQSKDKIRASGSSVGGNGRRLGRDVIVLSVRLGWCRGRSCSVQLPEQLGFSLGSKTLALGSQAAHL